MVKCEQFFVALDQIFDFYNRFHRFPPLCFCDFSIADTSGKRKCRMSGKGDDICHKVLYTRYDGRKRGKEKWNV